MRWRNLVLLCGVFSLVTAEPDPKKYNPNSKEKQANKSNTSLTEEEREFLKEVESKFGIKTDLKTEKPKLDGGDINPTEVTPFPAVIAIEIVNDTEVDSKGKRTIDANLGYGYKTNAGYMYSYFGKPSQEKGKFMIYPYSQEDIPPAKPGQYQQSLGIGSTLAPQLQQHYGHNVKSVVSDVEIQPSHAYELVPTQEESTYNYQEPLTEVHTKYEKVVGQEVPPPIPTQYSVPENTHHVVPSPQSTLYTTYSGGQLSGLSGSFPYIMPHYFVDSSQLLRHPQFQSAGLTSEHLQAHGHQLTQRIVPVLILRIPSSQLTSPTTDLYPNLPQNYPLSQQLNSVNLQKLVQQYFNKNSYSHVPQIYSALSSPTSTPVVNFGTQPYSAPQIQQHPGYTYADYTGIQYSGVQPVMAKYPTSSGIYPTQYYYSQTNPQYHQLAAQPQYKYQYQYVQPAQSYYTKMQPQYQTQSLTQIQSHSQPEVSTGHKSVVVYKSDATPQVITGYENLKEPAPEYGTPTTPVPVYEVAKETQQPQHEQAVYNQANEDLSAQTGHVQYNTDSGENVQKETLAIYPTETSYNPHQQYQYVYQQQPLDTTSSVKTLQLTENYPSPDHTIAKVLPSNSYPLTSQGVKQKINYVTPSPHLVRHPYSVMVPQIVLKNDEKVAHVYSHQLPQYTRLKSISSSKEQRYKGPTYLPSIESQRPATYPVNYHSHPRRMAEEEKTEAHSSEDTKSISVEKEKS